MNLFVECMGASIRWCGADSLKLDMPAGTTVSDVLHELSERYPELGSRRSTIAVAIGDEIIPLAREVRNGETLALIPPVSGG
ncbi:MoaD/ThiS family protein [Nevskia soli]|uniref:MoaD/ThiS family protein n=1 Tax=Nevskia soli TaxID=418856 RepID=UPI000A01D5CD|nr:MoaD/ThiS family protein [Nevskia soli]